MGVVYKLTGDVALLSGLVGLAANGVTIRLELRRYGRLVSGLGGGSRLVLGLDWRRLAFGLGGSRMVLAFDRSRKVFILEWLRVSGLADFLPRLEVLRLVVVLSVVGGDVGHVDRSLVFLVDKDIAFHIVTALAVELDLDPKKVAQIVDELFLLDVVVKIFSLLG